MAVIFGAQKSFIFYDLINYDDDNLHYVSENLQSKSKELERKPSGEAERTEALYTATNELKSTGLEVEDTTTGGHYPSPNSSRKTEPATPVFKLKDARPDICVGLSDESLADALEPMKGRDISQSFLLDIDPHVTLLGFHFPFLIVEAKAGATGGNLYQAQNQAAVGGSAALLILKSFLDLQDGQDLGGENHKTVADSNESAQAAPDVKLNLAFSIATEGPVHQLWLYF
ncbi:hypothetical protein BBP40_010135 [Aspergillus hancockii]|nr:hypothetical protein BBP40_010135 [Aspergillus hancockii]